jgi:hypothetical protein
MGSTGNYEVEGETENLQAGHATCLSDRTSTLKRAIISVQLEK